MSVPRSLEKSTGSIPLASLSLALWGLSRAIISGEEPAESAACRALDGRCFGDLFDEGGCGLVWRSRDRAFCSVSSVCASKFMRDRSADRQASVRSDPQGHHRFFHRHNVFYCCRSSAAASAAAAAAGRPQRLQSRRANPCATSHRPGLQIISRTYRIRRSKK